MPRAKVDRDGVFVLFRKMANDQTNRYIKRRRRAPPSVLLNFLDRRNPAQHVLESLLVGLIVRDVADLRVALELFLDQQSQIID